MKYLIRTTRIIKIKKLYTALISVYVFYTYTCYPRGDSMNKKQQEQQNRQKNLNKFNSVTEKVKPENQNQGHNVRSEAVEPKKRQV